MEDKILKAIEGLSLKFDSLSEKVDKQGIELNKQGIQLNNQGNQIKENTQILKALEHLAQVNKAEHDKMFFDIAEINGEVKNIRMGSNSLR